MSTTNDYRPPLFQWPCPERYYEALRTVEKGVAYEESQGDASLKPKAQCVRSLIALMETSAIADLLIKKGIITQAEYAEAQADKAEAEAQRYKSRLQERFGVSIDTLEYKY